MMRRVVFSLVAPILLLAGPALGNDVEAQFRIPSAAGEPGEEVALEFRATLKEAVQVFNVRFDLPKAVARFVRVDIQGTASAHAPPRGITFNPDHRFMSYVGYLAGLDLATANRYVPLPAGEDLLILKAIMRIHSEAVAGEYPIHVQSAEFSSVATRSLAVAIENESVFRVKPPAGPRPVGELRCSQAGDEVALTWALTEAYDAIAVFRQGALLASVAGSTTVYRDRPSPGPASYRVTATRGGKESLPALCDLLVQPPRPASITGFTCASSNGVVTLHWTNGAPYESITVFRNGRVTAEIDGTAESYSDPFQTSLFTVYTLRARAGGLETLPASCLLNESSNAYVLWADEARGEPGAKMVPVRVFGTNPEKTQGLQFSIRIDPAFVRIRELTVMGTVSEALHRQFIYGEHLLDQGEVGGMVEYPYRDQLPPGADQHLFTVLVDILPGAPAGTRVPVELGNFGDPPLDLVFTVTNRSKEAEGRSGAILIGDSPVPPVAGASADVQEEPVSGVRGGGAASTRAAGILLRWANAADYSSIRIERDGKDLGRTGGSDASYLDPDPGPGVHRYRITASDGARESFPVVVTARPGGIPGTFLRGDSSSDRRVNITDAVVLLSHLFKGGMQPPCPDAADADDSGRVDVTDAIGILFHLFGGSGPLPAPGPDAPWFDPTADELPCG